jgi:hypothetical protein|tara:strand:+ start:2653 stop:2835 length:183 start_codon:yes stop_codon:yes gene_type:complete
MFRRNTEPKFVIKVKQNRYEKFILDELRVAADSPSELMKNLTEALTEALTQLNNVNGKEE